MASLKREEREIRKDFVFNLALWEATKWGVMGSAVVGAATAVAAAKSKKFNKITSISAKVATPVMAGLFLFGLQFELVTNGANRNPKLWGMTDDALNEVKMKKIDQEESSASRYKVMPIHHKFMNWVYDNPFYCVSALGFPFAGYILKENLKRPDIKLSQKIMQSRVVAQGGVLVILLTTMGFREYMRKRGHFPDPEKDEQRKVKKWQDQ